MSFVSYGYRQNVANMSEAQDRVFGECFVILPMIKTARESPTPDSSRPSYEFTAIFTDEAASVDIGIALKVATTSPTLSVQRSELQSVPKAGDIVKRQCNGHQYEIKKGRPDGVSRIVFELNQMGQPEW